jgi:hypothetical protein
MEASSSRTRIATRQYREGLASDLVTYVSEAETDRSEMEADRSEVETDGSKVDAGAADHHTDAAEEDIVALVASAASPIRLPFDRLALRSRRMRSPPADERPP